MYSGRHAERHADRDDDSRDYGGHRVKLHEYKEQQRWNTERQIRTTFTESLWKRPQVVNLEQRETDQANRTHCVQLTACNVG